MEYRRLGRSGLRVSEICLGTMSFGTLIDEKQSQEIVDLAFEAGINFFDTADGYGKGRAEEILGKALQGRRQEAVVATKFFNPMGPGPNDSGMSRVHIMNAIEDSLRRLQMDHVDIYYIHHTDVQTPMEEMLRALDDLVHQGKVRYIACSNYAAWRLCEALAISEANGLARFECYQPQYSLVVRDIEQELVPLCEYKGLGIVAWGPLASGYLTGKYRPGQRKVPGTRSESGWAWHERFFASNADETLAALLEVAEDLNKTPAQVALRWVLEQPAVTATIVGVRTLDHLRDNVGATGWRLEGEALGRLNEVSRLPDRYPESFEKVMGERRESAVDMPSLSG
ncbi:MAG: aldo/keto reductase [Anaerolineae bacterium]|jgi:aryl-alcohol dehydrogenase-like predicted oxidoreductase